MSQSASFTNFRSIPAISHLDLFDLRPKRWEKYLKMSNRFTADLGFLRKKVVLSVYYLKNYFKYNNK